MPTSTSTSIVSKTVRLRDKRGRFVKAPKAEATPKVPAAVVEVPDLQVEDLVIREGYNHIPNKEYKKLLKGGYGVQTIRQAIGVMVALNARLPEALALVKADVYRPWMIGQLKVIVDHPQLLEVLGWVSSNPNKGVYSEYPSRGWQGMPKRLGRNIGKADALLNALTKVRTDGQAASVGSFKYLAEAAKLLGWIN